ncbi:unnamed protein product [Closterium sp. Yama58-4]|nr:unnamed protein product [Closterium sp. Yama58-4]
MKGVLEVDTEMARRGLFKSYRFRAGAHDRSLLVNFVPSPPSLLINCRRSFGVMMLEIMLTKPVVMLESGGINIRDWVDKRMQANDIEALKDPSLDSVPKKLLLKLVELALQCTSLLASSRPHMIDVAAQLGAMRRDFFEVQASTKDTRLLKIDKEFRRQGSGPQRSMEDELELLDGMLGSGT